MKIEGFDDTNIDSALCEEQQKTKEEGKVFLNVSPEEEEIFSGNRASAEAQKRDTIAKKNSGRYGSQHKREKKERMHELGVPKDEIANTLLGKAGFLSGKKTERQFELKEEPIKTLSMDAEQIEHNYEKINKKLINHVQAADVNYGADNLDRRVQFQGENAFIRHYYKESAIEIPVIYAESYSRKSQYFSMGPTENTADSLCNTVRFKGENENERSCHKDCAVQKPRNITEISFQEDHGILPGTVESRADDLYSTKQVEDLLKRESEKEETRKEEIISTTEREICHDKKNSRSILFNKLRLRKMKEAHGVQTEEKVEAKSNLQMPSEMKIVQHSVKSLMKKGAKSKIKGRKAKEEKEQDSKEQMDKQNKKEEKEKRKMEDKKRKLKERYERVMMKQGLGDIKVSRESYFQSYKEHEKRIEILELSTSSSSSNGRCEEDLLKNANVKDRDSAKPKRRTVSIAWDGASVGNNNIDGVKTSRITKPFVVKEAKSANQYSRRANLSELKTMENECKAKQDNKKVTENTQNSKNYMDEERMKRIVELFAAKEYNAAMLKNRASQENGLARICEKDSGI